MAIWISPLMTLVMLSMMPLHSTACGPAKTVSCAVIGENGGLHTNFPWVVFLPSIFEYHVHLCVQVSIIHPIVCGSEHCPSMFVWKLALSVHVCVKVCIVHPYLCGREHCSSMFVWKCALSISVCVKVCIVHPCLCGS